MTEDDTFNTLRRIPFHEVEAMLFDDNLATRQYPFFFEYLTVKDVASRDEILKNTSWTLAAFQAERWGDTWKKLTKIEHTDT